MQALGGSSGWGTTFFGFRGRIGRVRYVVGMVLTHLLFFFALYAASTARDMLSPWSILEALFLGGAPGPGFGLLMVLGLLAVGLYLWTFFALQVKRWHDLDKPGTLALLSLCGGVPHLGWIIIAVITISLVFLPGTPGANRYGGDPRAARPGPVAEPAAGSAPTRDPDTQPSPHEDPIQRLRSRLAQGEITAEEYRRLKAILEG
jgi:uncharacterized membrane protein YhaH (DUF805 family)